MLGLGGVVAVVGLVFLSTGGGGAVAGALVTAGGGWLVLMGARAALVQSVFHEASLTQKGWVRVGQTAQLELALTPTRALAVNAGQCSATYVCKEWAYSGSGSSSRTYTETITSQPVALVLPTTLAGPVTARLAVPIPKTVPPSWKTEKNGFVHEVMVRVDLVRWPDLTLSTQLEVGTEAVDD